MKILTETMLRAAALAESTTEYRVEPDVFVTPLAKEYLRDRGISLVIMESQPAVMTRTPLPGLANVHILTLRRGQVTVKSRSI